MLLVATHIIYLLCEWFLSLIESALSAFEKLVRLLEPGTLSLHRFLRIYEVYQPRTF